MDQNFVSLAFITSVFLNIWITRRNKLRSYGVEIKNRHISDLNHGESTEEIAAKSKWSKQKVMESRQQFMLSNQILFHEPTPLLVTRGMILLIRVMVMLCFYS